MKVENFDKVLVKYLRYEKGRNAGMPYAVIVAVERNKIGWAMCHKEDRFNKKKGKFIAIRRSFEGLTDETMAKVPHTIREEFFKMKSRSETYFK